MRDRGDRSTEYEIRRLDRRLLDLETELSTLRHSRAFLVGDAIQSRADQIADIEAEIAAARARLAELLAD